MPICYMYTNLAASAIKEGAETRIAHVIAATLNKPLERVTIIIIPDIRLERLGTTDPACVVNISSYEVFSKEQNPNYTDPLMEIFTKELRIPRERVLLVYDDLNKDMLGK